MKCILSMTAILLCTVAVACGQPPNPILGKWILSMPAGAPYASFCATALEFTSTTQTLTFGGKPSTEKVKDPASSNFTLYDFADRLRERGWLVPAYSMPPNRTDLVIQRILIRHGFTREMADQLLVEMERILDHLAQHSPVQMPALAFAGAGSSGHDHSGR